MSQASEHEGHTYREAEEKARGLPPEDLVEGAMVYATALALASDLATTEAIYVRAYKAELMRRLVGIADPTKTSLSHNELLNLYWGSSQEDGVGYHNELLLRLARGARLLGLVKQLFADMKGV